MPNFLLFCKFWQILHLIENNWLRIWILLDRFSIWKSEVFPFQKIGNGIPQFSRYFVCFLYFARNITQMIMKFLSKRAGVKRELEVRQSRLHLLLSTAPFQMIIVHLLLIMLPLIWRFCYEQNWSHKGQGAYLKLWIFANRDHFWEFNRIDMFKGISPLFLELMDLSSFSFLLVTPSYYSSFPATW